MVLRIFVASAVLAAGLMAAEEAAAVAPPPPPGSFTIDTGTKVPLTLINSVSTKHSVEGDRIYLETVFPVVVNGKIVIPVGSSVAGTVTMIKRPGRVKGRGELYVRFDSLILPNGTTRDFRARIGGMDGTAPGILDRDEGKVTAAGNKKGDLETIAEAASAGAGAGGLIGGLGADRPGLGVGVGALAGATAGMIGVLLSRGPDAVLEKGTTLEMVLDRPVTFTETELNFGNYQAPPVVVAPSSGSTSGGSIPTRGRFPF
jgi:type IV secretion system protein VirB10